MGELGYELHLENAECVNVYKKLMEIGTQFGLKNAGFRALNSLNCEKGNSIQGFQTILHFYGKQILLHLFLIFYL